MIDKFTIFVVYSTVLQRSLAMLSQATSGIHTGATDFCRQDFNLLETYKATALLQTEKFVQIIYKNEIQAYLTKVGPQDEEAGEYEPYTTKTCKNELQLPLGAVLDAVLAAILVGDLHASFRVTTARNVGNDTNTKLVESICSAILITLGTNSSGVRTKIQTLADERASGAATYNTAIFDAIRNGRDVHPRIESATGKAERKAIAELVAAIRYIFKGIENLISSGSLAESENVLSDIRDINNQAFSRMKTDLKTKFELIETMLAAYCMVEFGIAVNSSAIEVIKTSAYSDYGSAVDGDLTANNTNEFEFSIRNKNGTTADNSENQNAQQTAHIQVEKGINAVFETIEKELAKDSVRDKNVCENYSLKLAIATREASAAKTHGVDAIMEAIEIVNHGASLAVRSYRYAVDYNLKRTVDVIYEAIIQIWCQNSPNILTDLQTMEDEVLDLCLSRIEDIYDAMLYNVKIHVEFRAAIEDTKVETMSQIKESYHSIFTGILSRIAACSINQSEREGSSLSIRIARTESIFAIKVTVDSIFDAITSFCKASAGSQVELIENLSSIRRHHETAVSQSVNGINIIFRDIMDDCPELRPTNEEVAIDFASNIESGRAETSTAFSVTIAAFFSAIPSNHPAATSAVRNVANAIMIKGVDSIYIGINSTQGYNYSEILTQIRHTEDTTIRIFTKHVAEIYLGIQTALNCDAKTKAILHRNQKESTSIASYVIHLMFDSIRILLAATFNRTQTGNQDSMSSIGAANNESICESYFYVRNVFDAIRLVSENCGHNQPEIPADSCIATIF